MTRTVGSRNANGGALPGADAPATAESRATDAINTNGFMLPCHGKPQVRGQTYVCRTCGRRTRSAAAAVACVKFSAAARDLAHRDDRNRCSGRFGALTAQAGRLQPA